MNDKWFYAVAGQQIGPVDVATLQQLAAGGRLQRTDLVWRDGMAEWTAAGTMLPQLFGAVTPGYAAFGVSGGTLEYVGFWWRVLAVIIDVIITSIVGGIIGGAMGCVVGILAGSDRNAMIFIEVLGNILGLFIGWLYSALLESSACQATVGKMAIGVRVTDEEGRRISFGRATGRHFAKILSGIILLIGFIMVAFTQKKQGLHDLLAKTLVVKGRPG